MDVDDPEEVEFWDTTGVPTHVSDTELMEKMRKDLLRQEEIVDEAVSTFADLPLGSVMLLDHSIAVMKCSHSIVRRRRSFSSMRGMGLRVSIVMRWGCRWRSMHSCVRRRRWVSGLLLMGSF